MATRLNIGWLRSFVGLAIGVGRSDVGPRRQGTSRLRTRSRLQREGFQTLSSLIQASDGNFYGTTSDGGPPGAALSSSSRPPAPSPRCIPSTAAPRAASPRPASSRPAMATSTARPTVGRPSASAPSSSSRPAGTLTTLHAFDCSTEGCDPRGGLIQASDGNLYGTTRGRCHRGGTVFKLTTAGALTTLHAFDCSTEGLRPPGRRSFKPAMATSTARPSVAAPFGGGTVFKLTAAGTLTTLHAFDCSTRGLRAPRRRPHSGRAMATSTARPVRRHHRARHRLQDHAAGTLTTLHAFDCSTEGCVPGAGLIQASDGNFYGTTAGGPAEGGTVFKLTAAGTLTTLHSFDC